MAFGGEDDQRGKRKMTEPHDKQAPHSSRGRTASSSSSAVARGGVRDRGRREQFDRAYIIEYPERVIMRRPVDTPTHPVLNYARKQKMVEEAREDNTYEQPKDLGVGYKFWNEFHSNFYASMIFNSRKSKIVKMQYVDWEEIKDKDDPEFNKVIKACEHFGLTNIMSFQYNWNEEVLAQFHATFFYDIYADEVHWMTKERHYRVDFGTFCWILSFGEG
jgi:hypothetical protein